MKGKVLTIRMETDLLLALKEAAEADRATVTAYVTGLMVKDLRARGLLKARKRAK